MRSSGVLLGSLLLALACTACSGKKAKVAEAAMVESPPQGGEAATAATKPEAQRAETVPARVERAKPRLKLSLRSTPVGAEASVDGRPVGVTPVIHEIEDDGQPHEFVFVKDGYTMERYKFPPIRDGVVHARLKPIPVAKPDAAPTARR